MTVSRVVVGGVSGSGKSLVGSTLAARLDWPFMDADDLHSPASVRKMASGVPLDDADRAPWLERVGSWLASVEGGVIACSALRQRHRSVIRSHAPDAFFVQLTGSPSLLSSRLAGRRGHFMPSSLLASQLGALEELGPQEAGVVLDVTPPVEEIVTAIVSAVGA